MKMRTLIVDDEPLAREWLRNLLSREDDVEIVGEASDGFRAVIAIQETRPDVVFLDVQMPGLDAFGVLETLGARELPALVFVSAFESHALRAFDVQALDYILKPFGQERLHSTLERLRTRISARHAGETLGRLSSLVEELSALRSYPVWLLVREDGRSFFVRVADIDWIEAARNNVVLHVGKAAHVYHDTMQGIEGKLDGRRFLRIHRSTIVNIERVKELEPWFNGDYLVVLRDGSKLTLSATYRSALRSFRKPAAPGAEGRALPGGPADEQAVPLES
ncbi:MAG TPA: LytTR family DNA-binding domain-containing protein [Thermoanaerobaculia bacterium]|nr:LytTR family DNA-binding domain-containing protein [Thermoanaerobaculia bacterium]